MKIILLTDLHGRTEAIHRMASILSDAQLVLLAGDITHFGHGPEIKLIVDFISKFNPNILAVTGNCDHPAAEQYLAECKLSLTFRVLEYQGLWFAGLNGSLPCPGRTPQEYKEEEFEACLREMAPEVRHPFILLTHQPPYNTLNDRLPTGEHVGSKSIRQFIEEYKPLVCCTGHIHEGIGIDTLGETRIVNPGPARDGNYASFVIKDGVIQDLFIDRLL